MQNASKAREIGGQLESGDASSLRDHLALWGLLLFCVFVLFHNLGGPALFEPDEGRNAEVAREILLTRDSATPHYDFIPRLDKPIFYYRLVALSYRLFGVSEWSARFPSAAAALGTALETYLFARAFLGQWEALWSVMILITGVEFFILSRTVILDMTLTFFVTFSLCSFYFGLCADDNRKKVASYLVMYSGMGLATLVKGPIGFVLPGIVIFAYLFQTGRWSVLREMRLPLGILLFLGIALPWYAMVELRNPGYLRYFFLEENILRFLTPGFNRNQPWHYFLWVILNGFLPWTLLLVVVIEDLTIGFLEERTVFLVLWTVLPLFFFSFSSSKLPHYILPAYPPLSVLTGKSVVRILRDPLGRRSWVLPLPWITLAIAFFIAIVGFLTPDLLPDHLAGPIQQYSPLIPHSGGLVVLLVCIALSAAHWKALWTKPRCLFVSYCIGFVFLFLFMEQVMTVVSYARSSKELAANASAVIRPEDRLVIYDAYLPSLPFYLRIDRPMWVVWSGEKSSVMGSRYIAERLPHPARGHGTVLFTYEEFSEVWNKSARRLVVFAHLKDLRRLSEGVEISPKRLLQVGDVVVVSNR